MYTMYCVRLRPPQHRRSDLIFLYFLSNQFAKTKPFGHGEVSTFQLFACCILQWLRRIQIDLFPPIGCWGKFVSNFVFGVLLRVCSLEVQGMKGYGKHINKYLPTLHLFPNSLIILNIYCSLESCCIAFFVANQEPPNIPFVLSSQSQTCSPHPLSSPWLSFLPEHSPKYEFFPSQTPPLIFTNQPPPPVRHLTRM